MFPQIFILIIKHTPVISIDHMSLIILIVPFLIPPIRHMYMPVNKESRVVFVHQGVKNLKSLMWEIQSVV